MFIKVVGKKCTNEKCVKFNRIVAAHRTTCDEPDCGKELVAVKKLNTLPLALLSILLIAVIGFVGLPLINNDNPSEQLPVQVTDTNEETVKNIQSGLEEFVDKTGQGDIDGTTLVIRDKVFFDFDSIDIKPEGKEVLKQLATKLKGLLEQNSVTVEVQGHTDNIGSEDYNYNLSLQRAEAVLNYLYEEEPDLKNNYSQCFKAIGMGSKDPESQDNSNEGRALNRRISFDIKPN